MCRNKYEFTKETESIVIKTKRKDDRYYYWYTEFNTFSYTIISPCHCLRLWLWLWLCYCFCTILYGSNKFKYVIKFLTTTFSNNFSYFFRNFFFVLSSFIYQLINSPLFHHTIIIIVLCFPI